MRIYSLWDEIERMHEEMDRVFNHFFDNETYPQITQSKQGEILPYKKARADLYETDKEIVAELELPGINKEDIELSVTKDGIEVKGTKKQEKETKDDKKNIYRLERSTTGFYRKFSIPENTNPNEAEAKFENGVLKITVPKKELENKEVKKLEIK